MNFMEMVLALFAIVFFTTVSLIYNRSMWNQAESLDNISKVIQATQLAHSKLDEVDARLLSQQVAFAQRQPSNNPPTVQQYFIGSQLVDLAYAGYKFNITYLHQYCDSLGTPWVNQAYDENTDYKHLKMTVNVASTPGMSHPVAISRIYVKTNMYLDY